MTDNTAAPRNDVLDALSATFLRTERLLLFASEAEWQAGATPAPAVDDTHERSKGMTSEPVPGIVDDTRRQKLREAVKEAEAEAAPALLLRVLRAAGVHLEHALADADRPR